jgi:molybdopterin-containing oxidoreductase family iron-sulfur binding subunit
MRKEIRLDLADVRERLKGATGPQYWRALDEIAATPQFEEMLHREFPKQASEWGDPVTRRNFIKVMGASLALAGMTACSKPPLDTIVPYSTQPLEITPGKPKFFATTFTLSGAGTGLLVESHEGRPTKIEGNPNHPASLGATDAYAQASILDLYDPDRSQTVAYLGEIRPWSSLLSEISTQSSLLKASAGAGLVILTETISSPSLAMQIKGLLTALPQAKWVQFEPCGPHASRAGSHLAFGRMVNTVYHFDKADVVLSLDSDFLASGPGTLHYTREFAARRNPEPGAVPMNRLYAIESTPTPTGAKADHRLGSSASGVETLAREIAGRIGVDSGVNGGQPANAATNSQQQSKWLDAVARDLQAHKGKCLVIAGEYQTPAVHALAHAINAALGNVGSTVTCTESYEAAPVNQFDALGGLMQDLDAGHVNWLVILGGNPVHTAPADWDFKDRLMRANWRLHLSSYQNETSELCQWHVPATHYLESWGDARAYDGTISLIQPLIAPLYETKTPYEVLAALAGKPDSSNHDIVKDYWKTQHSGADFDHFWRKSLNDGIVADSALPAITIGLSGENAGKSLASAATSHGTLQGTVEIIFRPDPSVYDGRFANNGWMQEWPQPMTRLTWDNAALISPATAQRLDLSYTIAFTGGEHGQVKADIVEIEINQRKLRAPAWIVPGHPDDCVTLTIGQGRTKTGRVGTGVGYNGADLRRADLPWFESGAQIRKTRDGQEMACVQYHHSMEGRPIVLAATVDEYQHNPNFASEKSETPPPSFSLYPSVPYTGYAWGMTIDLNACTGCGNCVIACQAENNSPVVGKEQVMRGREMHWLRIDRYYTGDLEDPATYFQPVLCQQCENAPCEEVCPVGATVHSSEGLNDMVYNRCVGTRYCSNNCPYKVRRFNFFQYSDWNTPSLKLLNNPEVTVRSRGVMEKCTYCVQRINNARITSEKESRDIRDGEIQTACEAACPARAITFGNINDKQSRVSQRKTELRGYGLLAELNTRPRTTYLAEVRNPNPELEGLS